MTDLQASLAVNQFKRLNKFIRVRNENKNKIIKLLKNSKAWNNQLYFLDHSKDLEPSWFGLPILINKKFLKKKKKYLKILNKNNIETRPILSGNFMNQKSVKLYNLNPKKTKYKNSQEIEDRGFFIGLHTTPLTNDKLNILVKNLLLIDKIN